MVETFGRSAVLDSNIDDGMKRVVRQRRRLFKGRKEGYLKAEAERGRHLRHRSVDCSAVVSVYDCEPISEAKALAQTQHS